MTFLYGTCEDGRVYGCMPPLQIHVWNACERNETVYGIPRDETLRLRGVRAAFYETYHRLELFTGIVTVVISYNGYDRPTLLTAARRLRSVNGAVGVGERLPPRVPAVLNKRSRLCKAISRR